MPIDKSNQEQEERGEEGAEKKRENAFRVYGMQRIWDVETS